METRNAQRHDETIIEQFSKQAIPFARMPAHADSIQLLAEAIALNSADRVLDVACGPGLLACAFAKVAQSVEGIDITPAMIAQAEARQRELKLENLKWRVGAAAPLPYADRAFSAVVTRYTFHHFQDPMSAFREMRRVCQKPGRILIADVALNENAAALYDEMERLRDPSHHHALTFGEWDSLLADAPSLSWSRHTYGVDVDVEQLLASSFPPPGGADAFREMIRTEIDADRMGIRARTEGGKLAFTFPIGVFVGRQS